MAITSNDVYKEASEEFSAKDGINKVIEWKRANATTAINDTQKALIPQFININWCKSRMYFENGSYSIMRDYFKICLNINGFPKNKLISEKANSCFTEKMQDAVSKNLIRPFLLFVNKVNISWSRITFVRSDDYTSLLISGIDYDTNVTDVQILSIPFDVEYSEGVDENPALNLMYRFGADGRYNENSSIFIYAKNPNIVCVSYGYDRFKDVNMAILYKRKITSDNLVVFDKSGMLERGVKTVVKNTNLLTLDDGNVLYRYAVCCYSLESNENEANTTRALNEPFEKSLIDGSSGFKELNESIFLSDFDFKHDKSKPYDENIKNSLDYVFGYDENKLDQAFMDIRPMNIVEMNVDSLLKRYILDKSITMMRDSYAGDNSSTFPIVFHNGLLPSYYSTMEYTPRTFKFVPYSDLYSTPGFNYKDKFEVAFVRNVRNELIPLDIANKAKPGYMNIKDYYIPKEDIVVFSACNGEDNLYPLNHTIDSNGNIILADPTLLDYQLYIGSKKQFRYERIDCSADTNIISLGKDFRSAYDETKYMVFVNGRYLNRVYYRILIPSLVNPKISNRAIYTMKTIKAGDRIDIIYCSPPKLNAVSFNGDLLIHCIKAKAYSNGQRRFKVPYPYRNYPRDYDSFFCIKHSMYIDKEKYVIDGDYIEFTEPIDEFQFARDLIFVFPYYRPEWEPDGDPNVDDIIDFVPRSTKVTADSSVVDFTPDYLGDVVTKDAVHLFFNTTFIARDRYEVTGTNQITMNNGELVPANTTVTMTIEADATTMADNNVLLEAVEVIATEDKQYLFEIPRYDFYDSFFIIKGSVLMSPDRYFVSDERNIFIVNENDYVEKDKKLIFVFAKDKKEISDPDYHMHIKTEFMIYKCTENTKSIHLPTNYYHRIKFSKDNLLLFANSVCITSDRYEIKDNEVTMVDPNDVLFRKGSALVFMLGYKAINYKRVDGEIQNREIVYFEDVNVDIQANAQHSVTIPYPVLPFTDTEFMLSKGGSIIDPTMYTLSLDRLTLYYKDYKSLARGDQLRFTFVHNGAFTHISKKQINVVLSPGQTEVDIPSPYYKLVNLNNRMILTYGNMYLDKDRYLVDNKNKKVLLLDIPYASEADRVRHLTFTFFFTGSEYNGAMAYLPQSGYVCFLRKEITNNFNKEMYMMFVNGRKVAKSELLDVSNNLVKVKTDIERTYDLVVLNCAPVVIELKDKYGTMSNWTKMLDPLPL